MSQQPTTNTDVEHLKQNKEFTSKLSKIHFFHRWTRLNATMSHPSVVGDTMLMEKLWRPHADGHFFLLFLLGSSVALMHTAWFL